MRGVDDESAKGARRENRFEGPQDHLFAILDADGTRSEAHVSSATDLKLQVALAEVQRAFRNHDPRPNEPPAGTRTLAPSGPSSPASYTYFSDEAVAVENAAALLARDLRFEHLEDHEKAVWDLADKAIAEPDVDHVDGFLAANAMPLLTTTCYLTVEYLKLTGEINIDSVRLVPLGEDEIPDPQAWFILDPPVSCVAAVEVTGTDRRRMAERARDEVRRALRKLRLGLRGLNMYNERQLRFRLGPSYAFSSGGNGWSRPGESIFETPLSAEILERLRTEELFALPQVPETDVEKRADLAASWVDRSLLVTDSPLVALLYLFFALEALLGQKSEGLKGHGLAIRLAMLQHVTGSGFSYPSATFFLYDKVRSGAVHGEEALEVDWRTVSHLTWDARDAINRFLRLAQREGFKTRRRVLRYLTEHGERPAMERWLLEHDRATWSPYLAQASARDETS